MLERKNAFLAYKNKKFKKSKNIGFSKGVNPWFWSKNGYYPIICLGHIGQENVFQDILERKNVFLGYENKKFQKSKNIGFSKVVNPCFWSKNGYYPFICLGNIGQQNVFQDILDGENAFLEYKNISLKNLKVELFSNGLIHRFFKKAWQFFHLFFREYRPGKCFLGYSRTKKVFLEYKNKNFKKSKNIGFSKGVNPWF